MNNVQGYPNCYNDITGYRFDTFDKTKIEKDYWNKGHSGDYIDSFADYIYENYMKWKNYTKYYAPYWDYKAYYSSHFQNPDT